MNTLARYSALKEALATLEDDLGLAAFNTVEKRIIAALSNLSVESDGLSVSDLLKSVLLKNIPIASLYRALRQLKECDHIEVVDDKKTGNYRMTVR